MKLMISWCSVLILKLVDGIMRTFLTFDLQTALCIYNNQSFSLFTTRLHMHSELQAYVDHQLIFPPLNLSGHCSTHWLSDPQFVQCYKELGTCLNLQIWGNVGHFKFVISKVRIFTGFILDELRFCILLFLSIGVDAAVNSHQSISSKATAVQCRKRLIFNCRRQTQSELSQQEFTNFLLRDKTCWKYNHDIVLLSEFSKRTTSLSTSGDVW
jgi:hypothetical protein